MPDHVPEHLQEAGCIDMQELFGKAKDNQQHLAIVRRALTDIIEHELTDRQREMVYLYYFEGKNCREISEKLCVHKATVSRTLSRAKERIRKNLRFYFDYKNLPADED